MQHEDDEMWDFDDEVQTWDTPPPGHWTDPALVEAAAPLAGDGGPTEPLLAYMRDRRDASLELAEGISAATLHWPTDRADGRGRPLLDADPTRLRPRWQVALDRDCVVWSLDDTEDGLSSGEDEGKDDWGDDDLDDAYEVEADIPRGPAREFTRRLRAAFEDARRQVLLGLVTVTPDMIRWWSVVARGAGDLACQALDLASPGWQVALAALTTSPPKGE